MTTLEPVQAFGRCFADLACRLSGSKCQGPLHDAVVALCNAVAEGHVCLDVGKRQAWLDALRKAGAVGAPGDFKPLVLDDAGRLYLYRFHAQESELASALCSLVSRTPGPGPDDMDIGALFPGRPDDSDEQVRAVELALKGGVTVLTGGPGTGKTWTVARIAAALASRRGGTARIALCAPTGKAAALMGRGLGSALVDCGGQWGEAMQWEGMTIHRLLGVSRGGFVHGPDNPLDKDAVIVDEASMVDLSLMHSLVRALPGHACLVLVGDRDQLDSVSPGHVFADICDACSGNGPLAGRMAVLTRNRRFDRRSALGGLVEAVKAGRASFFLNELPGSGTDDVRTWFDVSAQEVVRDLAADRFTAYLEAGNPSDALALFDGFRFLCTRMSGPLGVEHVNRLCEEELSRKGLIDCRDERHYHGRPVMVVRNDYRVGLFNGDVGLVLRDHGGGGGLRAFFPEPGGSARPVHLSRLPEHVTCFAMTIHKSQGSEFDETAVVLPGPGTQAGRELLYTAVTRARRKVHLLGHRESLEAMNARTSRSSGLLDALTKP